MILIIYSPQDAFEVMFYFSSCIPILEESLKTFSITNTIFYDIMVMITIFSPHMMIFRETKLIVFCNYYILICLFTYKYYLIKILLLNLFDRIISKRALLLLIYLIGLIFFIFRLFSIIPIITNVPEYQYLLFHFYLAITFLAIPIIDETSKLPSPYLIQFILYFFSRSLGPISYFGIYSFHLCEHYLLISYSPLQLHPAFSLHFMGDRGEGGSINTETTPLLNQTRPSTPSTPTPPSTPTTPTPPSTPTTPTLQHSLPSNDQHAQNLWGDENMRVQEVDRKFQEVLAFRERMCNAIEGIKWSTARSLGHVYVDGENKTIIYFGRYVNIDMDIERVNKHKSGFLPQKTSENIEYIREKAHKTYTSLPIHSTLFKKKRGVEGGTGKYTNLGEESQE